MADEFSRWNELVTKLKQRSVKAKLNEEAKKGREKALQDVGDEFNPPLENELPIQLFDQLVVQSLTAPRIVTGRDLAEAFFHQVTIGKASEFEENYRRFIVALRLALSERASEPIEVLRYQSSEFLDLSALKDAPTVWKSHDDFSLEFNGTLFQDIRFYEGQRAFFSLVGFCSERAMSVAAESVREAVSTLLRSFQLLADQLDAENWQAALKELTSMLASMEVKKRSQSPDGAESTDAAHDLPRLSQGDFPKPGRGNYILKHLSTLIDAYFERAGAKSKVSPFATRIRNACHLLVAADNQTSNAIGMSLSITAIETLLYHGSNEIAATIAEIISRLFEPKLEERAAAFDYVRKLYDRRSRVLHGENLEFSDADRQEARLVASAVLLAILSRQEFVRRTNRSGSEKPEEFLREVRQNRYLEGPIVGVPLLPINHLWHRSEETSQEI